MLGKTTHYYRRASVWFLSSGLISINTKAKNKRDACLFLGVFLVMVLWTMAFLGNQKLQVILGAFIYY